MQQITSFDFLVGNWTVKNQRLKERLGGCTDWVEFELNYEFQSLLGGLGNMDRMFGEVDGSYFEGVSFRTYNEAEDEWTIYWSDISNTQMTENTRGRFVNGIGEFYGMERHKGSRYLMRFLWKSIDPDTAHWEQAYFDPATERWETNWTMEFSRV